MSISNEIIRLQNAKSALATSIGNKGVQVPAATKLDGYPALVDAIQTGGGGTADDGTWHRPSNWPDYSKIPMSGISSSEVYLTYDCRYAKAGIEPAGMCIKAYATGGYTVERGYIGNSGFVAVASQNHASSNQHTEMLPTDEGDFVVYRVTPQVSGNSITNFYIDDWTSYIGNQRLYGYSQSCIEIYGKLEYVTQPSFRTEYLVSFVCSLKSATQISNGFQDSKLLENVDATLWNTASFTAMSGLFSGCTALKYIDVSKWDTSNVTKMDSLFYNCRSLVSLDVSKWDTAKVTTMAATFRNTVSLNTVDISKWDTGALTTNQSMFDSAYKIKEIHFNNTLTLLTAGALGSTRWCTTYIFESTTPPTFGNGVFNNFNTSAKIYVPDNSVNSYKTASGWLNYASYIYPISDLT